MCAEREAPLAVFRRRAVPRRADNSNSLGSGGGALKVPRDLIPARPGRVVVSRPAALVRVVRERMDERRSHDQEGSSHVELSHETPSVIITPYRPALDGKLEDRVLLSTQTLHQYLGTNLGLLKHPQAGVAFHENVPPFALNAPRWNRHFRVIQAAAVQTIRGGQAVNVVAPDGSHFRIQLGYISNTVATSAGDGAGEPIRRALRRPR